MLTDTIRDARLASDAANAPWPGVEGQEGAEDRLSHRMEDHELSS